MPGSAQKFHTRHKFGKKRKKSQANNFKARLLARSVNEDRYGSPADAADASLTASPASPACDAPERDASPAHPSPERGDEHCEHRDCATPISSADSEGIAEAPEAVDGELGLAGPPVTDASQSSGCVRRDTTLLTQSELQVRRTKADSRLQELASTAASKRKFEFLKNDAPAGAAPTEPNEEASFLIADLGCFEVHKKNGLKYTTILSDGDSRTFLALQEADVYGFIKVQKEDCVNHVQKRMGTALRNLVARHKGGASETLGGRGRLTGDLIAKLSSYYGWALKSHKGDVEGMHRAAQTLGAGRTQLLPKGSPLQGIITICHNVCARLFCQFMSALEAAAAEAVMKFNCGNLRTSTGILDELSLNPSLPSVRRMTEKDRRRVADSNRKRASSEKPLQTCAH
ncbi:hypothetical protein HPB52_021226 [Rhipicephalus sanguineus]|uniref:Mutator-like transposase domain-containing protein n=1 Tax=Rhipicephalus sanguineus TaxID=34632 RepID=A0A9D4Q332_RHISA|nr:hypothetical protein HPB52_021226 [Rhipicephalus sanguineus]